MGAAALSAYPAGSAPKDSGHPDYLGWKPHLLRKGDGKGGWRYRDAEYQILHKPGGKYVMPFGVTRMDNGELLLVGSWHDGSSEDAHKSEKPVTGFSRDSGGTWTALESIAGAAGRPVMLAYTGGGNLFFQTDLEKSIRQFFTSDYGRTWTAQLLQPALNGEPFNGEGNMLVDRDSGAGRIAAVGYNFPKGTKWPKDPSYAMIRWSTDGGRTWKDESSPSAWRWQESYNGTQYTRSISEGSLVRAANGWLVAALRTDMPPKFLDYHNDNLEGTGISLSKDDGRTWSPLQILFPAGRMHSHLLRLGDGALVMTHIMRQDIDSGRLASYRRGCGAVLSRDNGQTWDMARRYVLDEFEFSDGKPNALACGHLFSTLLADGFILTAYGHYVAKGAALIRWKPDAS
jgi:hypothetical protein